MDVSGDRGAQRRPRPHQGECRPSLVTPTFEPLPKTRGETHCVVGGKDACGQEERSLVENALKRLPPLDPFANLTGSPQPSIHNSDGPLANTSFTSGPISRHGSSYALGADEEALLLQELVNLTAGTTPFITSAAHRERCADGAGGERSDEAESLLENNQAGTQSLAVTPTPFPCALSTSRQVSASEPVTTSQTTSSHHLGIQRGDCASLSAPRRIVSAPTPPKVEMVKEEEGIILDTILAALDGQQSSISGDFMSETVSVADTGAAVTVADIRGIRNEGLDEVDVVLEQAKRFATSTVLSETPRDELVLHIHEQMTLRHKLASLRETAGTPTCVALAESVNTGIIPYVRSRGVSSVAVTRSQSLSCAMGTTLGVVILFDHRWAVLGICGSVEASAVNVRGAVVSLSLCTCTASRDDGDDSGEKSTAATGHARGIFILWSLHTLAPLRIVSDESKVPLLRVVHLHRDPTHILVLDSSGAVKLYRFCKVMTKYTLRAVSITPASATAPISDMDTLPCPSCFYMTHLSVVKEHLLLSSGADKGVDSGVPWLCAPPPLSPATAAEAGLSSTMWSTIAGKHFVATVRSDAVLVYLVEAGSQSAITDLAHHSHRPSSARGNELVRFVVTETETTTPRVLLCVSWNTEVELLLINLRVPESHTRRKAILADPMVEGLVRLALIRVPAPLLQMVPLAGCNVLLCDENSSAQLMDASVAAIVERHRLSSFEYLSFSSPFCGVVYNGCAATSRSTALLMGKGRAYGIALRSWRERLSSLLAGHRFTEALDLAKGFAEEVALSTVGLSSNAARRRCELHQFIELILVAYVKNSFPSFPVSEVTEKRSDGQSKDLAGGIDPSSGAGSLFDLLQQIISYCSAVDGLSLLYGPVVHALQQRGLLSHLLCVLEHCMRCGLVTYMPEPLIEQFVHLFLDDGQLYAVERALGLRRRSAGSGNEARRSMSEVRHDVDSASRRSGKERAELALMYLDTDLPTLLRLAEEHGLVRLTVLILSLRQQRYVDALAYAMDEEEKADTAFCANISGGEKWAPQVVKCSGLFDSRDDASVAVDLVECTLKGGSLLPGADLAASEQRPAKKALLEYLLLTTLSTSRSDTGNVRSIEDHNLLRFLRRRPEHAIRVLLFALSDEGPCSPWGGAGGLSRTQFVSSMYFILTGGSRTRPRDATESDFLSSSGQQQGPLDIFRVDDEALVRLPALRTLKATELAQRPFPPYITVHTFLAGAAIFNELFLSTDAEELVNGQSSRPSVRLDVWVDLVIQDALFAFQSAETAEERRQLQEHLLRVLAPDVVPRHLVSVFQSDFTRLQMTRCLAAVFCVEQRYTEAIACYTDPKQNRVDAQLQYDVFAMLRGEMQRLQSVRAQRMNVSQQELSACQRSGSSVFDSARFRTGAAGTKEPLPLAGDLATSDVEGSLGDLGERLHSKETSRSSIGITATETTPADAAIKALQRAVMSRVEVLARIDATALAQFIFDYLPSNHSEVMRLLRGSSAAFLDYLHELMTHGCQTVANDMSLQNTYIELLCAHAPDTVYTYLRQKGNRVTYDMQLALRAVRKHGIADATVYLLEKVAMIDEAMKVMLAAMRERLSALSEEVMTYLSAGARTTTEAGGDQECVESVPVLTTTAATHTGEAAKPHTGKGVSSSVTGDLPLPFDLPALRSATELWRFVEIGKELCSKYEVNGLAGGSLAAGVTPPTPAGTSSCTPAAAKHGVPVEPVQHPEYWFRLLDVFMVPRHRLCALRIQNDEFAVPGGSAAPAQPSSGIDPAGMSRRLHVAVCLALTSHHDADAAAATLALTSSATGPPQHLEDLTTRLRSEERRCIDVLVAVYTQYACSILQSMMRFVDISVVANKLFCDNRKGTFWTLRPIVLDLMASFSFDLKANRLCEQIIKSDAMRLGREHYLRLNAGVAPQSDCCAFCHTYLSQPPPSLDAGGGTNEAAAGGALAAVSVYTCGHAFHTICAVQAMGSHQGCWVCMQERLLSGKSGERARGGDVGTSAVWSSAISGPAGTPVGHQDHTAPPAAAVIRPAATTIDIARMQRRVRQTKVNIDRDENFYSVLKSYLAWPTTASCSQLSDTSTPSTRKSAPIGAAHEAGPSGARAETGKSAPPPSQRLSGTLSGVQGAVPGALTTLEDKLLSVDALTDSEILELFGEP
ncbi:hypothetical protein JKF63_00766 [Porcisia hertigi]|uniref:Uncharacterized protein n=1 Tax=Porcisia hertigi TaxID=2761500 RepID=A0A836HFP3_9TRYP|nr:hypothetical protein JKF63_00766 [Porcisia hertigi]